MDGPIEPERQQQFEQCVNTCADSLFRVAYRLTGNNTLAQELVQETYLQAWKSIASLSDPEKMRGWMFAILRNQYTKLLRTEKKAIATHQTLDHLTAEHNDPNPEIDNVQTALNQLPESQKMPLLLVAIEGLTVDQTASILDIPRGTVLSRLHRGRQALKQIIQREPN